MGGEAAVIAAWVGALAAGAGAVIAWFKERALNQEKAAFETSLEGYKHTLGLEAEKLKAQLQAGLASLEARERLRAELQLRILAADEARVDEQLKHFERCLQLALGVVTDGNGDYGDRLLNAATELSRAVMGSGHFLPDDLGADAGRVIRALADIASLRTQQDFPAKLLEAHKALESLGVAAREWRRRARTALLEA